MLHRQALRAVIRHQRLRQVVAQAARRITQVLRQAVATHRARHTRRVVAHVVAAIREVTLVARHVVAQADHREAEDNSVFWESIYGGIMFVAIEHK